MIAAKIIQKNLALDMNFLCFGMFSSKFASRYIFGFLDFFCYKKLNAF